MVTVSLTDKKPIYLYKEDIPKNMVSAYVLASSYLPVFKPDKLLKDEKTYIDGGFYDNCPLTLLKKKEYKDIIEVRTHAIGLYKKIDRKGLNIITINPSKDLGSIIFSDNKVVRDNIKMGYFDALRVLKGYIGDKFYVVPKDNNDVFNSLLNINDKDILKLMENEKITKIQDLEPKKILFEKILPQIEKHLKDKDTTTYQKLVIAMIEHLSEDSMEIYKLYTYDELLSSFKKKIPTLLKKEKQAIIKNNSNILMLNLLKKI